ncbi:putative ABC transporter ATP-binding protein YxlF [Clostridium tepidiprofundi DSM 19306]|uniref:Putative ABC transporter ATP-binding protein YxlF n=1 Tax=Clostridium tepidiprofundi DSM 19306 TaxID=1121338 RepID=A0A151B3E0_9CLOT|nr:ABC transporter ATP-binding protein [Clostridium tepidiprofundi]KYH34425.1 putative ABC transporter ATP-binding protein YxlF [Clostridium tepidiprofundi DSM 19306]
MSLIVKNLYKEYHTLSNGTEYVINNLSFTIEDGQVYSLIGQNGVGKTTTIKCILKLIRANEGKIKFGNESIEILMENSQIGYLPENLMFPGLVSLYEFLYDMCTIKGMKEECIKERINELTMQFDINNMLNKSINKFSKGMKRKVGFIQAIINEPKILILDEPTDGLDPISRRKVLKNIREFADRGNIVLITSHILSDLRLISDKVGLMHRGKLLSEINTIQFKENNKSKITFEVIKGGSKEKRTYDLVPMTEINVNDIEKCIIKDFYIENLDLEEWYLEKLMEEGGVIDVESIEV